ncbi:hypothetical protein DERP_009943 [Dermatophagoides pteronyssinus]|uniref:Secreted protein n=1 Tax=Dermatophagoides pteronyssinus TaxID=6956 RepID=A0ABQ8J2I2_DERPT|nr:hypothetical protein DERP_009943 [Dermatophagoides pteronyssinus]
MNMKMIVKFKIFLLTLRLIKCVILVIGFSGIKLSNCCISLSNVAFSNVSILLVSLFLRLSILTATKRSSAGNTRRRCSRHSFNNPIAPSGFSQSILISPTHSNARKPYKWPRNSQAVSKQGTAER